MRILAGSGRPGLLKACLVSVVAVERPPSRDHALGTDARMALNLVPGRHFEVFYESGL